MCTCAGTSHTQTPSRAAPTAAHSALQGARRRRARAADTAPAEATAGWRLRELGVGLAEARASRASGVYPREMKVGHGRPVCAPVLTEVSFTVAEV